MTRLTKSQFKAKFEAAKNRAFLRYFQDSPVDTGYLRSQIKMIELPNGNFQIYNEVDYMKYTEEAWTNGRTNPNEGWFRRATEAVFNMIVQEMRDV